MKEKSHVSKVKVFIDRIEGDVAVIVLYDDDRVKFNLPVKYLPEGARGGDHYEVTFTPDEKSRDEEKRFIEELLKEMKDPE